MIKKWNQFIREFIESGSYIDSKMQELKDLIDNVTDGQNIIYEWENKDDHQLSVSFSTDKLSIKYDFDIDDLYVTKTANNIIDFETEVSSIDEGLEIIEKDIQSILNISESKSKFNISDSLIKSVQKEMLKYYLFDLTYEQVKSYLEDNELNVFDTLEREEYAYYLSKEICDMRFPLNSDSEEYKKEFYQKLRRKAQEKGYIWLG